MVDNLIEKISANDFNAEKFVRELAQRCVGGQELQQQRKTIQALAESTNIMLKKNVYRNYMQFIETAKEITHLESEMYQLSHLLTEQKSLLEMANVNMLGDQLMKSQQEVDEKENYQAQAKNEEDDRIRILTSIMEKVEGCTGLLEVKERTLLHEGDILELDPVENTPLQRTHAYLFSDALMLTSWITNRRGPVRYKMYAMYDLISLAVVNVRDLGSVKMAFKILAYPDTRLFQCLNNNSKKEWLEHFDYAKRAKLTSEQAKRETGHTVHSQNSAELPSRNASLESPTVFDDELVVHKFNIPEWMMESPEELDVLIAERHFEMALELLMKCQSYIEGVDANEKDPLFLDVRSKVENRKRNLIDILLKELEVSPDKSLQGGLRAARRAVRLLNTMNKSTQACDLMLKLCTSIMKKELKCVKREGATFLYIKQVADIFYRTLLSIIKEFRKVFPSSSACNAALIVWTNNQLTHFMSHVIKQVFVPQSSITVISECVSLLRLQNAQLCDFGLDMRYQIDGMLHRSITITLQDSKDKLLESIKHRSAEEKWRPMNLQNKNNLNKLIQELTDLGLPMVHNYIKGLSIEIKYWTHRTQILSRHY
ncbi:UNVERIFIED_CONTAM: hypothetical protein PYX00_004953 [Menopon gallinae]|uniref:Exocyst complex component 8 n=1 Tax=Menopon gallinae TaxID=328185 RepID=A0AAW2I802_9NEOP